MKPTLKQIFDFGTELVEKEKFHTVKNKEYSQTRHAKRYSKQVVVYTACILYNYDRTKVASFMKIDNKAVSRHIGLVTKSRMKQDLADELWESLKVLYGENKISLNAYKSKILPIFANEMNFNTRSPEDLTKLEKWLINRLYEVENR